MNCKFLTPAEIDSFQLNLASLEDDFEDTLEDTVIPFEKYPQELQEEEWEFQNAERWIEEYEQAQAEKDMPIIEHWFYHYDEEFHMTRIRGIHKKSQQVITTSRVMDVTNDILITESGSTYRLFHAIDGEGVSDICEFWPMYQDC